MSVVPPISENRGTPGTPRTRCAYPQFTASRTGYRADGITRYPRGIDPVPGRIGSGTGQTGVPGARYLPGTRRHPLLPAKTSQGTGSTGSTDLSGYGREGESR